MLFLAQLIPRILHNVNRVCYIFGGVVQYQLTDITYTHLSSYSLSQLRQADYIANEVVNIYSLSKLFCRNITISSFFQVLQSFNCSKNISQMPVVLIPLHFDRDPANRIPSCQRSIVLRPFVTNDFMTGLPVLPGSDKLPMHVSEYVEINYYYYVLIIKINQRCWSEWYVK